MKDNTKKAIVLTSMVYIAMANEKIVNASKKEDIDSLYKEISTLKDNLNDCFEIYNNGKIMQIRAF